MSAAVETDETRSATAEPTADITTSGTYSLNVALYVREDRCEPSPAI